MAESDDEKRRRSWLEAQNQLAPGEDPIERMLSDMAWAQIKGWHRVRTVDGGFAVFPEAATDEDEWERKSLAMHEAQEPVEIADKPVERGRLRSDSSGVADFHLAFIDETIPSFHETSPASTEVQRRTKRSN